MAKRVYDDQIKPIAPETEFDPKLKDCSITYLFVLNDGLPVVTEKDLSEIQRILYFEDLIREFWELTTHN